ncbi:MAG: hypothetical protein K8T25_21320 [Planctomycetia bacterium]|nr:hypothetical protein [Planctomycetia bacterium]
MLQTLLRTLGIVWASPWTLLGICVGICGLATGGRARRRGRTIEFYEGGTKWFLTHLPHGQASHLDFPIAMTLGHVILGRTDAALDISREHELVHVRQYERWGPFFGPAYLLCSLVLWMAGRDAYRDNPFERQAYDEAG